MLILINIILGIVTIVNLGWMIATIGAVIGAEIDYDALALFLAGWFLVGATIPIFAIYLLNFT